MSWLEHSPCCSKLSPPIARVCFPCFGLSFPTKVSPYLGPEFVPYLTVSGVWIEIGPHLWAPPISLQVMGFCWSLNSSVASWFSDPSLSSILKPVFQTYCLLQHDKELLKFFQTKRLFFPFSESSSAFPRFPTPGDCSEHFLLSFDARDSLRDSLGSLSQGLYEEINQVKLSPILFKVFFF